MKYELKADLRIKNGQQSGKMVEVITITTHEEGQALLDKLEQAPRPRNTIVDTLIQQLRLRRKRKRFLPLEFEIPKRL